jgi:hypothetical protein
VLVGSVCRNLIDLGSYLRKELDTRKYLKITRDHRDVNAKLPNLHLLSLAFDRRWRGPWSLGSPAPWAVSGSAEAWNREGRRRGSMGGAHRRRREAGAAGTEGGGGDAGGQLGADTGGGAAVGSRHADQWNGPAQRPRAPGGLGFARRRLGAAN